MSDNTKTRLEFAIYPFKWRWRRGTVAGLTYVQRGPFCVWIIPVREAGDTWTDSSGVSWQRLV